MGRAELSPCSTDQSARSFISVLLGLLQEATLRGACPQFPQLSEITDHLSCLP